MSPIRVMVVDDNQDSQEILMHFLAELPDFDVVGHCNNGEELVEQVMKYKPELILTDINMPHKNGINAIKDCLTFYPDIKYIFITGYDEYAIEAFNIAAIDYIVKPIEKSRLYKALEKAKSVLQFEENLQPKTNIMHLPIKDINGTYYVPQDEIYFIEKSGKKCIVYTKDKLYETQENIGKLVERLNDSFFSAHRSFVINLRKVDYIVPQNETYIVYFQDFNKQASISKLKISEVKEKMEQILTM
jgi:two-component system, LytTR family, response regulator